MKYLKIMVVAFLLCGCGQEKLITVCKGNKSGEKITMISDGNLIRERKEEALYSYEELNLTKDEIDLDEFIDSYKAFLGLTKGLEVLGEFTDEGILITVTIDYTKAEHDQLEKLGLIKHGEKYADLAENIVKFEAEEGVTCTVE